MSHYVFLGEAELAAAFRLTGVDVRPVDNQESALRLFTSITRPLSNEGFERQSPESAGCLILILTEQVALWLGEEINSWQLSGRYPLIVEIPGLNGPLPGKKSLVDSIREAIGVHV
ncbi:MAG: ATPase V [Spirochaetaceae bacterium]|nr:ATPase V [Spirochaetaceae bacterium]